MPSTSDLILLGIGYRHVKGGEDEFAAGGKKIRQSAHEAGEAVNLLEKGSEKLKDVFHDVAAEAFALAAAYLSVHAAIDSVLEGVKLFAEFDSSLAELRATTQATAGDMDLLSVAARAMGASTDSSAARVAAGMTVLSKAGETTSQILANIADVENLSDIAHVDYAEAADQVSLSLARFNLPAEQAAHVIDVLAATSQRSRAGVGDLVDVMKQAGPAAGAMGLKLEDLSAALGVMSQQGGNARASGGALLNVLAVLSNPTKEIEQQLRILGLTLDDLSPRTHSLTEIIETLARANLDAGSAFALFGHQGGAALLQLTQNIPALVKMRESLDDVDGVGARLANDIENNLASSGEHLEKVLDAVKLSIGAGLAPALSELSKGLQSSLREWQSGAESFGAAMGKALSGTITLFVALVDHGREVAAVLIGIGVGVAAVAFAPLIAGASGYIVALVSLAATEGVVAVATLELSLAWDAFTAALLANPVTLVAVALGALAAILYEVISRSREAAKAEAEYQAELASGVPKIDGVVSAHAQLAAKLLEEIDLRQKLSSGAADLEGRYIALASVGQQMTAALQSGDRSAYDRSVQSLQQLGVTIQGNQSALEAWRAEMDVVGKEVKANADKTLANNERIATSQKSLKESVVQALEEEVTYRLLKQSQLTDAEAKQARAQRELQQYLAGSLQPNQVKVLDLKDPVADLQRMATEAERARQGLAGIDAQLKLIRGDAADAARAMADAGNFEGFARTMHQIGVSDTVIQQAIGRYREIQAEEKKEADAAAAAAKARDDAIAKQREQQRLYADEIKTVGELTLKLNAQIAGHRAVAAAFGESYAAGVRVKAQTDDEAKATEAAAKFTGARRQAVHDLTLEELQWARAASQSEAVASLRLETEKALAISEAKLRDVTAGNTQASVAAATRYEGEEFRVKNLLKANDPLVASLKRLLQARDEQIRKDQILAENAQLLLEFTTQQRQAEADLRDAWDQRTLASQNLAIQLEIEDRIRKKGAQQDVEAQNRIAAEVIGRHAVIAVLVDEAARVRALQQTYRDLDSLQARFADGQQVRRATQALGSEIAGILQKYGLLSNATKDLEIHEKALALFAEEHGTRSVAAIEAELQARRQVTDEAARGAANIEIAQLEADKLYASLAEAFGNLSTALGGASTGAGRLAADLGNLVTVLGKLRDAGKAWSAEWSSAMAAAIGAAAALVKELNIGGSNKTGGQQALGGRLEGNYAGIGSIVGAIIGAVVGYFTAGVGTGAGFAIGTALGTVLGSLISKAGDSASASLSASGNVIVGETSRQLDGAVSDALKNIFKGLQTAMASLGLLLQGIPLIDIKVRDNIVRVIVGGIVRTFSSMQDAISFGIAEALKQAAGGAGGHLPPEVIAALKNTTATDLQALQSDIDFARSIANYGVPAIVQAIDKCISDFYVAMQRAVSLGIDTGKVIAQFADQLQAQKDQLLGINKNLSPQDQLRKDVAAFNAKVSLLKAQEQADVADLLLKKVDLQAKIELAKAEVGLRRAVDQATLESLKIMEAALGQIDVALASAQAVIDSLVAITDQELADALARLGKGGGGADAGGLSLADQVRDAARQRELAQTSAYSQGLAAINDKWDKAIGDQHLGADAAAKAAREHQAAVEAAGKLEKDKVGAAMRAADERYQRELAGIAKTQAAIEAANKEREAEIALLRQQTIADLYGKVRDFEKDPNAGSTPQGQLAGIIAQANALRAEFVQTASELGLGSDRIAKGLKRIGDAMTAQVAALAATVISGLGLPMEQTREKIKGLGDSVSFLRDMAASGIISTMKLGDVLGQLGNQATTDLLGQAAALLEQEGRFDEADKARRLADELNFELQVLQFNFLLDSYEALGILSAAQRAELEDIRALINDPANQPNFNLPAPQRPSKEAAAASTASNSDDSRRQAILDQITAWNDLGKPDATKGLRDLNATFVSMSADAQRLGISLASLSSAYGKAVEDFWDKALAPYEASQNLVDQLGQINKTFDDLVAAARQYGGDQARIERDRLRAVEDFWNVALQPIKDLRQQLAGGQLGGVSPENALAAAQANFNSLAIKAQGGDAAAIQALPTAVQALLDQQRAFSGTGPAYQALVATIQGVLDRILGLGGAALAAGAPGPSAAVAAPAGGSLLYFPSAAPRPASAPDVRPLPAGGYAGGSGPAPAPDPRFNQVADSLSAETGLIREGRKQTDDLRGEVDRLIEHGRRQEEKIDDLLAVVGRLTSLVEIQERGRTQGRKATG